MKKPSVKYLIITLAVVIPAIIAILIYNDTITQNSPTYYRQGTEFYNKGDYQNAYYNFLKIKKISPLYQMAVFKQAKSAQKVNDYTTAAEKYSLFLKHNENSIFADSARYNLAKCYYYLKNYEEAKKLFEESKAKKGKKTSVEDYYLGLINKNIDKDKAIEHFLNYLD
ncbi:tetratricopeptide repeat protein, partial [bacterium]|nr:tetratricopeptide repeat protein [bacterium]